MGLRLVTLNLNGIRSAAEKGFEAWAEAAGADCMGVQEVKAQAPEVLGRFGRVAGLQGHFHFAEKKGYSGVGLYTRKAPSAVVVGLGTAEFDAEGRYVEARFDSARRKLSLISCYFPSGSSGPERQAAKYRFLDLMLPHLATLAATREFILVGDLNIAHTPADLKNWRGNQKNSGFLPEERDWMDKVFGPLGYVDAFRVVNQEGDQYTWWSNRGRAWEKNVGWRIDYQVITPGLRDGVREVAIYKEQRFSDHAPLTIDYEYSLDAGGIS